MSRAGAVLLTGASGVVGRAILRELGENSVVCLVHGGDVAGESPEIISCDLSRERFGLSLVDFRGLAERIGAIVHSAALTEWGLPEWRYQETNVEGTRQVIELACMAGAPVHFVSSAFVAALRPGPTGTPGESNVIAGYLRSKLDCEALLGESGVAHSVYRPTNLIGHSTTGWTAKPQIVQLVSDWVCRGRARFFPAHPGNRFDLAPQDLLAKVVVRALRHGETGADYWITYGTEAMTVDEALGVLAEHTRTQGRALVCPPVVHPDDISGDELAALSPTSRSYVRVLRDASEVVACAGGILPSSLPLLADRFGLSVVPGTVAYHRTLTAAN